MLRHADFVSDDRGDLVTPRFERIGDTAEELARSAPGCSDQAGNADFAAATARSMSAGSPAGIVANRSSVVESITSSTPLPEGSTHAPSM